MPEQAHLYRVKLDQTPDAEWQSEIGYQIAQTMACRSANFRGLAFEILDAQLEPMKDDFMKQYWKFKESDIPLTKQSLKLLYDDTCLLDDILKDIQHAKIKYESAVYQSEIQKLDTTLRNVFNDM